MRHSRTVDPGTPYDAVIVGSGFGGSMVAQQLVDAGGRVLMIERGGWVAGYQGMFRDFLSALATGHEPRMTLARARRDLELVESAYANARESS